MSDSLAAHYASDLFLLEYDGRLLDHPWIAWAECEIDIMCQSVVRFHNLDAEGFGHDEYGWFSNVYLRRNRLTESIEFVIEDDGYGDLCVVEAVWDNIDEDQWEALLTACYDFDARAAFEAMLEITSDRLRIAELTADDEKRIKELPLMGYTLVRPAQLQEQAAEIAASMHLDPIPFHKVVKNFRAFNGEDAAVGSSVVYLPDQISEKCTTDAVQVNNSAGRWFALIVNRSVANPVYLANILNTRLGMTIRESMESTHFPRIRPEMFDSSTLYLPPLTDQNRIVRATEQIRTFGLELSELNLSIWETPSELDATERKLAEFDPMASFVGWIDSLPYPLASILWSYHSMEDDAEKQYRKLLHFFEALAEYVVTVMVSAFSTDDDVWERTRDKIKEAMYKQNLSIERATFGTWKCMLEILAKETRTRVSTARSDCLELYKTRDVELVKALSSTDLVNAIKEANRLRNNWLGHAGAVSQREAEGRHKELKTQLERIREVFGAVWRTNKQLMPNKSAYDGKRYRVDVEVIGGSRTPFAWIQVVSREPLESKQLYLWGTGDERGLKLVPFVKILASPKTEENACYYYSRLDSNGPRYLSYHFGADSDITLEDGSDVIEALKQLGLMHQR